ncbi:MAG TPA: lipid-binding SYLF domain-containing protein [Candidatus Sulfopaludibacter sp.]|jgi:lipid-binding SYLF domain-containing protein|nr:lipid-binding SYLF domain-containing protein [Candidatus Sulfopaludibacter sp.]
MKSLAITASFLIASGAWAADQPKAAERLNDAAAVLSEVMATPDKAIPQELFEKAECVIIIPSMKKAAFVVGGEYGRGFAECRNPSGTGWGAPAAVRMEGGSVGFQIGGSATDLIMLVMNKRGMQHLLGDKFTLGADASLAAGPVGRTANANTDVKLNAEILAWSRSKGLFAGVSLNGATLRPDTDRDAELYGRKVNNREILMGSVTAPPDAHALTAQLDKYSSRSNNADRSGH